MSYREQFIWQKAVDLAVQCYQVTERFPKTETYGLVGQIRRSSVSVASNIAEGYGRKTKNEYIQFLHIALGSLRELDTQLIVAKRVNMVDVKFIEPLLNNTDRMQGILVATLNRLKQ
ncbi:MAG: four helix bundle protein [Cyanobacteria bacterium J06588_4]